MWAQIEIRCQKSVVRYQMTEEIKDILRSKYPEMEVVAIRHEDLVYEERVRLKCVHCRNYRTKWTCPGRLPELDYAKITSEYAHMAVVVGTAAQLHEALLYMEAELFRRNEPLAVSFIGGSCELCKEGCNKEACAHPEQARISWTATGCNVTKTLANIGIEVDYTKNKDRRYGLLMW